MAKHLCPSPFRSVLLWSGVFSLVRTASQSYLKKQNCPPLSFRIVCRFAVLLGLKLAPETAKAMQSLAMECSPSPSLPPRRIWLELNKLQKAETKAPGSCWPKALKLSYHLGLLQYLFPWLQASEKGVIEQAVTVAGGMTGGQVPLELKVAALVNPGAHGVKGYDMVSGGLGGDKAVGGQGG